MKEVKQWAFFLSWSWMEPEKVLSNPALDAINIVMVAAIASVTDVTVTAPTATPAATKVARLKIHSRDGG